MPPWIGRFVICSRSTCSLPAFPWSLRGNFAQIPPVVPNGSKADTIMASIRYWTNWDQFTVLYLTVNMRLRGVASPENSSFTACAAAIVLFEIAPNPYFFFHSEPYSAEMR